MRSRAVAKPAAAPPPPPQHGRNISAAPFSASDAAAESATTASGALLSRGSAFRRSLRLASVAAASGSDVADPTDAMSVGETCYVEPAAARDAPDVLEDKSVFASTHTLSTAVTAASSAGGASGAALSPSESTKISVHRNIDNNNSENTSSTGVHSANAAATEGNSSDNIDADSCVGTNSSSAEQPQQQQQQQQRPLRLQQHLKLQQQGEIATDTATASFSCESKTRSDHEMRLSELRQQRVNHGAAAELLVPVTATITAVNAVDSTLNNTAGSHSVGVDNTGDDDFNDGDCEDNDGNDTGNVYSDDDDYDFSSVYVPVIAPNQLPMATHAELVNQTRTLSGSASSVSNIKNRNVSGEVIVSKNTDNNRSRTAVSTTP